MTLRRPSLVLLCTLVACNGTSGSSESGTESATSGPTATTNTTPGSDASQTSASVTDASADGTGPTGETVDTAGDLMLPVGHCGARLGSYFPAATWIYEDITDAPVHPDSDATTAWLAAAGGWGNENVFQIDDSFVIVDADASTPTYPLAEGDPIDYYTPDCDPGPMMPIPAGGHIEGYADYVCPGRAAGEPEGDCHLLVADFDNGRLHESYQASFDGSTFYASCVVAWDMTEDHWGTPPASDQPLPSVEERNWGIGRDCTGPDAAGFPIAPLLFTVGDVMSGRVEHAIRFILPNERMRRSSTADGEGPEYVWPATHAGGPEAIDPVAPVYGSRWRLRPDFDPASRGLDPNNPVVQAVVYGLQHHGMLLADGGNIALTAENASDCPTTWDDLWGEAGSRVLAGIEPTDFQIIDAGPPEAGYDCVRN